MKSVIDMAMKSSGLLLMTAAASKNRQLLTIAIDIATKLLVKFYKRR